LDIGACVKAICGDGQKNPSAYDVLYGRKPPTDFPEFRKTARAKLRFAYQKQRDLVVKISKNFDFISSLGISGIFNDPKSKILAKFIILSRIQPEGGIITSTKIDSIHYKMVIDWAKVDDFILASPADLKEPYIRYLQGPFQQFLDYLNENMALETISRKQDPILVITRLLRPNLNFSDAYSDLRQETLFFYERFEKVFGGLSMAIIDERAIRDLKKISNISLLNADNPAIAKLFYSLAALKLLTDKKFAVSLQSWTSIESTEIKKLVESEQLNSDFSRWGTDEAFQKMLDSDLQKCESIYKDLASTRPRADQIAAFKQTADEVKAKSVLLAARITNNEAVLNELRKTLFFFPLTGTRKESFLFKSSKVTRIRRGLKFGVRRLKHLEFGYLTRDDESSF
jgi:hypothetical protein